MTLLPLKLAGKAAGGWLMGNIKWIAYGSLMFVALYLGKQVYDAFQDREQLLEERQQTVAQLLQDLTISEIEAKTAKDALGLLRESQARIELLQAENLAVQAQIREEQRAQKAVLEDQQRLTRLTEVKPGLIERLANNATQERHDEMAAAFNQ